MVELASRFPEHKKLVDAEVICKFILWAAQKGICLGKALPGAHFASAWPCDLTIKPETVMADYMKFDSAAFTRESAQMRSILDSQEEANFRGRN